MGLFQEWSILRRRELGQIAPDFFDPSLPNLDDKSREPQGIRQPSSSQRRERPTGPSHFRFGSADIRHGMPENVELYCVFASVNEPILGYPCLPVKLEDSRSFKTDPSLAISNTPSGVPVLHKAGDFLAGTASGVDFASCPRGKKAIGFIARPAASLVKNMRSGTNCHPISLEKFAKHQIEGLFDAVVAEELFHFWVNPSRAIEIRNPALLRILRRLARDSHQALG